MLTPAELRLLDAHSIAESIRSGRLSAIEVTDAALSAIATIDPVLHAFTHVAADASRATAKAIDTRRARGEPLGPLAGVPVPVKDLIFTNDMPTTFGSPLYEHFVPTHDDIVVERLRAADAVIVGKTNVSEFGYGGVGHNPVFPTTRNPWNPDLTSGGSSAGSAVAVATGIAPLALGSDGGGSVRLPASFNGIFGMKASMGRVPLWPGCRDETLPGASGWETIEHIGPLARTVADAQLLLSVIAGPDPRDRHSIPCSDVDWMIDGEDRPLGLRIAWCADWGGLPLDPEVRAVCGAAARVFESDLGCVVEETPPPFEWDIETFRAVVAMDTDFAGLKELAARHGDQAFSPRLRATLERQWRGEEFLAAASRRRAMANAMARFMSHYDLLLTPTVSTLPFPLGLDGPGSIDGMPVEDDAWTPTEFPSNLTGHPAASVPAGWSRCGLPIGLQICGRHLDDRTVLAASRAFERARPWNDCRPPLPQGGAG